MAAKKKEPKQRTLWMVQQDEDDAMTLEMEHDRHALISRKAEPNEITVYAIGEMLDQDAENGNMHDFVGTHWALGGLLSDVVGDEAALKVMRRLADCGGLHGLE